ncbi:MAG TPA: hypothetical protein VGI70_21940 [Polyangiales bacterium]
MGLRGDAFIGCAIVLCTMSAACAPAMGNKQDGQPCTRSDQCALGLICSGGACAARLDGGAADAGMDEDGGEK